MTIIRYGNADDIDIQLEDGTVSKHKTYRQFIQGFDGISKTEDLTGQRFGKLLVLERVENHISPNGQPRKFWKCQCDCGNVKEIASYNLTKGLSKSCGCSLKLSRCRAKEGITDLASQYPDLLKEWDYEKNIIKPNKIGCHSPKKVWWKCSKCGYSWNVSIGKRTRTNGSNCPKCSHYKRTSFPEQAIYYYVKQIFSDAINSDKHLGMEFDIYIPSLDVAIEYDGQAWHNFKKNIQTDIKKNQLCIDNNIELIRIREPRCVPIINCSVFYRKDSVSNLSLDIVISDVLRYLTSSITIDVDTTRDTPIILSQYATKQYENSLAYCYPDIAKEWHPTKNGDLTPDNFTKGSNVKVWWLGKCGHEYQMSICAKTEKKYSQYCPICFKKKTYPPIICIETNEKFENATSALKLTNLTRTDYIYACCRGKQETAGGYHWEFADDNKNKALIS